MIKLMKKQLAERQKNKDAEGFFSEFLQNEKWAQGAPNNTVVSAEVKAIDYEKKKVIVYTGFKSNSSISFQEFRVNDEENIPKVSDIINVMVKGVDPITGLVIASFREVQTKQKMEELEQSFQQKQQIDGTVLYKMKSSFYKNNSYVVDLGFGIHGILTSEGYTEIQPGDKISVEILKFENKKLGILLAKKRTIESASNGDKHYQNQDAMYKEGEVYNIRITEIKDFGIVGEKVTNENDKDVKNTNNSIFVHVSELYWNRRSRTAVEIEQTYPIGKEVEVLALKRDQTKHRMVFSIRALFDNLFTKFQEYLKTVQDSIITGKITEKRNESFIITIPFPYKKDANSPEVTQSFEGRLYMRDLSWNANENMKIQMEYNINSEITCKVLNFAHDQDQIESGFGLLPLTKKLGEDPFRAVLNTIRLGDVYPCQFGEYSDHYNGFLINLKIDDTYTDSNITVLMKHRDLGSITQVKSGLASSCKIIRIEDRDRIIFVSAKAAEMDKKASLVKEYESNNKPNVSTLGSIIDSTNKKS